MNYLTSNTILWAFMIISLVLQPIVDTFFTRKRYYWSGIFAAQGGVFVLWLLSLYLLRLAAKDDPIGEGRALTAFFLCGFSLFTMAVYGICSIAINLVFKKDIRNFRTTFVLRFRPWLAFGTTLLLTLSLYAISRIES